MLIKSLFIFPIISNTITFPFCTYINRQREIKCILDVITATIMSFGRKINGRKRVREKVNTCYGCNNKTHQLGCNVINLLCKAYCTCHTLCFFKIFSQFSTFWMTNIKKHAFFLGWSEMNGILDNDFALWGYIGPRTTWDKETNFGINHTPSAGSTSQSIALLLWYDCLLHFLNWNRGNN